MPVDHIRYDILAQEALRGVVRKVLADVARKGLLGEHHFYITFDTGADGVRLSPRLRGQHPQEMTVILQHQFWDLSVDDEGFEVGLSFGGIPERISVPFAAIKAFFDPAVQFALQFEKIGAEAAEDEAAEAAEATIEPAEGELVAGPSEPKPGAPRRSQDRPVRKAPAPAAPASPPALPAGSDAGKDSEKPSGGADVVRLDRFRKK